MLLADPDSPAWDFSKKIQSYINTNFKVDIPLHKLIVNHFNNEEIRLWAPENLRKRDVYFIHDSSKNPQEWLVELLLAKDLLIRASAGRITFVLPHLLYSRQDRKEKPHVPISAKAVADSISSGIERVITMDLHAPQIQGFYDIPVDNLYSFPEVCHYLKSSYSDLENFVIVSPDAGGVERARAFAFRLNSRCPIAFVEKRRQQAGEVSEMYLIGDIVNKDIFVVDDIIDSGGTLLKVRDLLINNGAQKMFCYGTHGLFTKRADERLSEIYDKIFVSDTVYYTPKDSIRDKIEIISVTETFGEAIYRAYKGLSISELFENKTE